MVNDALYVIIYTTDFTNGELIGNSFVGMDDDFTTTNLIGRNTEF